jgi:hypothetical protein
MEIGDEQIKIKKFECNKCGKLFKHNYLLTRHNNKIKSCDRPEKIIEKYNKLIEEIDNKINNLYDISITSKTKCNFCNNIFHNKSNLKRHIDNYCNSRKELEDKKNKYINNINTKQKEIDKNLEYIKETEELKQTIKHLQQQLKNKINSNDSNQPNQPNQPNEINQLNQLNENQLKHTTHNTHNTQNNNINIYVNNANFDIPNKNVKLNSFGSEDLSHITNKDYERYLSKFFPGLLDYIEHVHFSKDQPSNHNICIPKINSKYIAVFEKDKWNLKDKKYLLDRLISKKIIALNIKCDELEQGGLIKDKIVELHREFNNNYIEGGDETKKDLETDVTLLIFNNRNKIKDYDKLLK